MRDGRMVCSISVIRGEANHTMALIKYQLSLPL